MVAAMSEPRAAIADHAVLHALSYFGLYGGAAVSETADAEMRAALAENLPNVTPELSVMAGLIPLAEELLATPASAPSWWRIRAQVRFEMTAYHLRRALEARRALAKGAANE